MKKRDGSGPAGGLVMACVVIAAAGLFAGCSAADRSTELSDVPRSDANDAKLQRDDKPRDGDELILQATLQKDAAAAGVNLSALMRLREGRVDDAINLLETALDGQIISLGMEEVNDEASRAAGQRMLKHARIYRERYPQGSSVTTPEVKKLIEKTLAEVE